MKFIAGIIVGLFVGWMCGTWSEHRLWLDAICGRERAWQSRTRNEADNRPSASTHSEPDTKVQP